MTDLLHVLFNLEQEMDTLDYWHISGYREARRYLDEYYQKVKSALGEPFLDELLSRVEEVASLEALAAYRQGFRLAGRLSLEFFGTRL